MPEREGDETLYAQGLAVLEDHLGPVQALRFLALISRQPFDYQRWRQHQLGTMSLADILAQAQKMSSPREQPMAESRPKVFISSSLEDSAWVRQFAEALKDLDVAVLFDEWQIKAGDPLRFAIEKGVRDSDAIVAVLSAANILRPNVLIELGVALGMGKRFIPILSQDVNERQIPFDVRSRRYLRQESPEETAREVAAAVKGEEDSTR
jgi:predicted nucleotide-binding protein